MPARPAETPDRSAPPDWPDLELMQRIGQGDESALAFLMRRHWSGLVDYAASYLPTVQDAEDVGQETFLRVWQNRGTWTPRGTVRGYLFTIARNLCLHHVERSRVRRDWVQRRIATSRPSSTVLQELEATELHRALEAAIAALPERRREIFELVCLDGLSYQEAADVLGVALSTVANQMSAALRSLRRVVRDVSDLAI